MSSLINKTKPDLLQGSLIKSIIRLGYPMALGSLVQTLYNLADAFWLGKLGRDALAAPIISFFILFFLIAIGLGFSISGTSLVAQYIGANEPERANRVTGNLLLYLILMSTVLTTIGLLFGRQFLTFLQTPAETFKQTYGYYRIVMAAMPFTFPMFVYQSAMNGYGDTMSPLKIQLFTAGVNLVMDPVLIFGYLGFPALGVEGAAVTTAVTQAMASFIGLYLFFSGKKGIRLRLKDLKPDFSIARLMIKIGVPSALGFSGSSLGFIVLITIVNQFGTAVVSVYGIGTRIVHFFMLPAMGISSAITAIVGQNLGAGQIDRAKKSVRKGMLLMLSIVTVPAILCAIFGKELTAVFIPGDPLAQRLGQIMFYITPPSLIFFGLGTVLEGAFQGAGNTVPVMVAQISRIWLFRIPTVYLISMVIMDGPTDIYASIGIWIGMVFSNGASLAIVSIWFKFTDWAKAAINKQNKAEQLSEQTG